jgi:hypothetical protein
MAFSAKLHLEGHSQEDQGIGLTGCSFTFSQAIDQRGMSISRVNGGVLNLTFSNLNDFDIVQWMFHQQLKKNGKIVFSSGMQENQSFQTVKFKDGLLVTYHQSFSEDSEMSLELTVSCREIEIAGATFCNIWQAD